MSFNWTPEELQAIVDEHSIVLFMKGTPEEPRCGFSNRAAQVLQQVGVPFSSINILTDPRGFSNNATNLHSRRTDWWFGHRSGNV